LFCRDESSGDPSRLSEHPEALEQLRQVPSGNGVSATVDTDRDVVAINELLTVDREG
jgi:hypothetical protein